MAEGATAGLPPWKLLWEARPVCQSWRKITPPFSWTALVAYFQPSVIASV